VAVSKRVPLDLRRAIFEALLRMADDPACRERLGIGLVERFVQADPSSYDDIRRMLDATEAARFTVLR
jgi:ABC-type phosphate/phosphonate transport system substrate-binding protein